MKRFFRNEADDYRYVAEHQAGFGLHHDFYKIRWYHDGKEGLCAFGIEELENNPKWIECMPDWTPLPTKNTAPDDYEDALDDLAMREDKKRFFPKMEEGDLIQTIAIMLLVIPIGSMIGRAIWIIIAYAFNESILEGIMLLMAISGFLLMLYQFIRTVYFGR